MALNGSSVLLVSGATVIGSQTNVVFSESREKIDVSEKSSSNKQYIYGFFSSSVTLDHLYVAGDTGRVALLSALENGTTVTIHRRESGSDERYATALVTKIDDTFPQQKEGLVKVVLDITGGWTAE